MQGNGFGEETNLGRTLENFTRGRLDVLIWTQPGKRCPIWLEPRHLGQRTGQCRGVVEASEEPFVKQPWVLSGECVEVRNGKVFGQDLPRCG
jgi:hypothetical protein